MRPFIIKFCEPTWDCKAKFLCVNFILHKSYINFVSHELFLIVPYIIMHRTLECINKNCINLSRGLFWRIVINLSTHKFRMLLYGICIQKIINRARRMFGCPTSLLMNKHLKENWVVFVIYCGFIYALCHYCVYYCVVLISYEECMVLWAATASICFFSLTMILTQCMCMSSRC